MKEGLRGQGGQCLRTLRLHPSMLAYGQLELVVTALRRRGADFSRHRFIRMYVITLTLYHCLNLVVQKRGE